MSGPQFDFVLHRLSIQAVQLQNTIKRLSHQHGNFRALKSKLGTSLLSTLNGLNCEYLARVFVA